MFGSGPSTYTGLNAISRMMRSFKRQGLRLGAIKIYSLP